MRHLNRCRYAFVCLLGLLLVGPAPAQERSWDRTLETIASGVVSIRVDSTRAFDTERNLSTQATGFVVDAERGIILTNRHVVTPGPVRAQAIFLNQEEVELVAMYRDPVHDFGFFRYDPADLKFIRPAELPLVPEAAQVGRDIRVVGNDAGEQLSILAGTIARLDRQAPNYGRGNYNDFNTVYLQAASGTSGGSSGSPVIDIEGRVVALNAGANTQAASSFFLPLDRVRVALQMLQDARPVPRGSLQTEFVQKPYAELRRLGLQEDSETLMRDTYPRQTGLLVVEQVIPGSAAAGALEPGDILISIDGELVAEFVPLAAKLDSAVGDIVEVVVERGGDRLEHHLPVDDLHSITPAEYIEYGEAVLHELSYQLARGYYRPLSGIYVANPGYVFGRSAIPRAAIITALGRRPVSNLDELEQVLETLVDGERVTVNFLTFDDPQIERQRLITPDRSWFPARRCARDDATGSWPCKELDLRAAARPALTPQETTFPRQPETYLQRIAPSLVLVNFDMPYTVSGISDRYYYGTGLIVDAERGWVVVDRNTVPVAMGDVRITIAGSLEIPGRVEYIHPLHNLAIISYDTALIGNTPVRSARLDTRELAAGNNVFVVGVGPDYQIRSQSSQVADVAAANFPMSRTLRFRDSNLDVVSLVNGPTDFDGVIVDAQGRVSALWASFAYQTGRDLTQVNMGITSDLVAEMSSKLAAGEPLRSLEVEWRLMPLTTARMLELDESWVARYEAHNPERRQMLAVSTTVAGTPSAAFFRSGDLLLEIDGAMASTFRDVERASQAPQVEVTIFRDGQTLSGIVDTVALDGIGVDRVVLWGGALLQAPHRELAAQRQIDGEGAYVSYFNFGSPASRYGLYAGRRIVAVDGQPTLDLDAFLAAVGGLPDRASLRLNTMNWNNVPEVITLRTDEQYWPGYQLVRDGYEWRREPLQ